MMPENPDVSTDKIVYEYQKMISKLQTKNREDE